MTAPRTVHDFGPLSPELFKMQYPAPGDPELARRVHDLLAPTEVTMDASRGLDHGTWVVLLKAYPDADVPVVQLSMDVSRPPEWRVEIGQRLQPLRDEGILIIGSGNIVHNLSLMDWDQDSKPYDWAERFNEHIKISIVRNDPASICNYPDLGSDAALSVPNPDHFWPLLYVLGARDATDPVTFETDFIQFRSLGMTSVCFGARPPAD